MLLFFLRTEHFSYSSGALARNLRTNQKKSQLSSASTAKSLITKSWTAIKNTVEDYPHLLMSPPVHANCTAYCRLLRRTQHKTHYHPLSPTQPTLQTAAFPTARPVGTITRAQQTSCPAYQPIRAPGTTTPSKTQSTSTKREVRKNL